MARTDAELLIASRDDPHAFRELYDRWADKLLAYFYGGRSTRRSRPTCWRRRSRSHSPAGGGSATSAAQGATWLYGIAAKELSHWFRNQAVELRAVRRLAIEVPALDDESIARIEALADMETHRGALAAALDKIGPGERDAVQLRVVEELGYAEIASALHCTEAAARTRVHRGLAHLNRLLEVAS